ncbi:hypothetical protein ACH5RR_004096 [Cinchona calisaya]|uniref:Uncharacterized protein n=1 Tax=Cinchona calisaya TaxID=153742 RepID=A0ABD3AWQ3_9GENT
MGRKCSHCGNVGHNSRTCTTYMRGTTTSSVNMAGGLRLFGVQLHDVSSSSNTSSSISIHMKKSFSLDCLSSSSPSPSSSLSNSSRLSITENSDKLSIGYLSDGLLGGRPQERKKGVPWTEEEHRSFLIGLEKLGKGDWRGISRNFVTTRTPTQVASHAQKYFLRQACLNKKKRRSSLFDMIGIKNIDNHHQIFNSSFETNNINDDATTTTLLDLNSFGVDIGTSKNDQDCMKSQEGSSSNQDSISIWPAAYGSLSSQLSISSSTSSGAPPDLELTLAGPENCGSKQPAPRSFHPSYETNQCYLTCI